MIDRKKIKGGAPHGYRLLGSPLELGPRAVIGREKIRYRRTLRTDASFDMPNKDPAIARQTKREWYVNNREDILRKKREKRVAQKLLNPPKPKPPKPPPTEEEKARKRELNRLACNRYRAKHLPQVRSVNRKYYHRHRDYIVQQQRERRARNRQTPSPSPFRKLRALADVCTARLLEEDHGYTSIETAPPKKSGNGIQKKTK